MVSGEINSWISNFLSGRKQCVVVEGEQSMFVPVESGVPQGSVLGPCLFLFYINDIPYGLKSTCRLFADDTIVYLTVKSNSDAEELQDDLNKLAQWEKKWSMEFHPDKCNVLSITRNKTPVVYDYRLHGHTLQHVSSAKYLGVTFNSKLTWGEHIDNMTQKANKTLGFLRRNVQVSNPQLKQQAYRTLVRPVVEYACPVWDPYTKTQIRQIEMVQRRAARYVKNRYHNTPSVSEMIQQMNWRSLHDRRRDNRLCMLYKVYHQLIAVPANDLILKTRVSAYTHDVAFFTLPTTGNMHSSHLQYVNGTVYQLHLFTVQVLAISALGLGCWITAPSHVCQFSNLPTSTHCKYVNNEVDTIHQVKFFTYYCTLFVQHRSSCQVFYPKKLDSIRKIKKIKESWRPGFQMKTTIP